MKLYTAKSAFEDAKSGDWKFSFFDFIDAFLRAKKSDMATMVSDEPLDLSLYREGALLRSIVLELCERHEVEPPDWSLERQWLQPAWFVSGVKALYASALQESPINFKHNNIFVLDNFLNRA